MKRGPIYLRYRDLVILGACEERNRFRKQFGDKVLATVTTAVANATKYSWLWIAESTLTMDRYTEMRRRMVEVIPREVCFCPTCDPDGVHSKFVAQCFAEAFLEQGGIEGLIAADARSASYFRERGLELDRQ